MTAETLAPDVLLTQTNLVGSLTDIDDDPDSPDGLWLTANNNNQNTVCIVSFGTPTDSPTIGAGLQAFQMWARITPNATNTDWSMYLLEGGVRRNGGAAIATGTLTNGTSGEMVSGAWDAALLSTADGSAVECEVVFKKTGGSSSNRSTGEAGAVEWNADVSEAMTPVSRILDMRRALDIEVLQAPDMRRAVDTELLATTDMRRAIFVGVSLGFDARRALDIAVPATIDLRRDMEGGLTVGGDFRRSLLIEVSGVSDFRRALEISVQRVLDLRREMWVSVGQALDTRRQTQQLIEPPPPPPQGSHLGPDITPVPADPLQTRDVVVLWETLNTTNHNGTPVTLSGVVLNLMVQALGTFGASATITMQGSLDGGTTYFTLKDPADTDVTLTAADSKTLRDKPLLIRPTLTSGDGSTDVDVYLMISRSGNL